VRVWAIRLLTDFWPLDTIVGPRKDTVHPADDESLALFVKLAKEDASGLVRLSLASTLQRLPVAKRTELATALVSHSEDADDAQLPAMVWFGLIPLAEADPTALLSVTKVCTWPKTVRWAARYLAMKLERQPQPLNELLLSTVDPDPRWRPLAVLEGMAAAFKGWQKAPKPASWGTVTAKSPHKDLVRDLSILFGDGRALDDVKKIALDPGAEFAQRQAALETLIANRQPDLQAICTQLLDTKRLCSIAVRGLALVNDPTLGQRLAADYRKFDPDDRPAVMNFLLSRAASAKAMLANIGDEKTQIPRADITAFHARQIRAFGDAALTKKLTEVWGELRESTEDKRQLIQRLKTKLTPAVLAKADLSQGRVLFQNVCAACHTMYGSGGRIGPDLTGSGRANLDYLLENIVDPSAVVPADYRMSTLTLKDGRILSGAVAETNERTLTLRTPTEPVTIERSEIVKQEVSPLSMMPEGLLQVFQPDQVRDLIAYLMHPAQVPLPRN
jgi:putative heme-binding domain-containing protein